MDVIVFAGSTARAARTSSSILLAAGAKSLGLEPLHVQVLTDGGVPALVDVTGVPFATSTLKAKRGEPITERTRTRARRGTSHVIVDMPAQDIRETLLMLGGMRPRILVLMPNWATDPGRAVSDFRIIREQRDHWEELNRQAGRPLADDYGRSRVWLFPIGWPAASSDDLRALLRGRGHLPSEDSQYPILYPGLPMLDPGDMEFTDGSGRFALTERQLEAAARTAWPLCGDTA